MSWAALYIADLKEGRTVRFRPRGHSMTPLIQSGELCTVEPRTVELVNAGDVVLCKVRGNVYLHKVLAKRGLQVQIGNNHGHVNGWTRTVYGKLVKVEP